MMAAAVRMNCFNYDTSTRNISHAVIVIIQKLELLNAIRGTNNGKNAGPQQQIQILQLVRDIEMTQPNISLCDANVVALLNGTWYLQYTSPSEVNVTVPQNASSSSSSTASYVWEPNNAQLENVETRRFNAQGTVSAAGITIDTSNQTLVQQIFNTDASTVMNRIYFSKSYNNNNDDDRSLRYAVAGGTYRPSAQQANRAIVAFDTAYIHVPIRNQTAITLPLGWFFNVLSLFRKGNRDNGWLETTYIDTSLRIGRGNKGTMFILTREPLSLS